MSAVAREYPDVDAVGTARALHVRFNVYEPCDIDVELAAAELGATVQYRDTGSADARVVREPGHAYIVLATWARGTPRALFSLGHEVGHLVLHPHVNGIDRLHGRPRESRDFPVERQADKFAVEYLMPEMCFLPRCQSLRPCLDDVRRMTRVFKVSLTAAGRRWAQLSPAPCAFVESNAGVITHVKRSPTFRAAIAWKHAVPEGTLAWALGRGEGVEGAREGVAGGWKSAMRRRVTEESFAVRGTTRVITWLTQEW